MASHLNRIRSEIKTLKTKNEKFISPGSYYIVEITVPDISDQKCREWAKDLILDKDKAPVFVYTRLNEIFILYECLDCPFLEGSHQRLCSYYSSVFTRKSDSGYVKCGITELETQNEVFTYLLWRIIETQFLHLARVLEVPVEKVYQMTLDEACDEAGDKWDRSSKFKKFGTVYKLREKNGKIVLSSFSKTLDARKRDHYLAYLFG